MKSVRPSHVLARVATVLSLAAVAAVGLAAPAAASRGAVPHVDNVSNAHCLGWAISQGAVLGGPRAVAEHQAAVREDLGQDYGRVTASVAKLPTGC